MTKIYYQFWTDHVTVTVWYISLTMPTHSSPLTMQHYKRKHMQITPSLFVTVTNLRTSWTTN